MDSIKLVTLTWKWKIGVWKMIAIHMSNNSSKYFRKIRSWNFLLSQGVSNRKEHRDWCQKFATDTFAHKSKSLNDRVKSQARSQNYWSIALTLISVGMYQSDTRHFQSLASLSVINFGVSNYNLNSFLGI